MIQPALRRSVPWVAFAGATALLLHGAWRQAWTSDDALITFRYVHNWIDGNGLVYNVGERIESFSSFLFVLILAPFEAVGADLFVVANVVGVAASVAELGVIIWLLRRETGSVAAAAFAGLLFATTRIVQVWSTGGLETSLEGALLTAALAVAIRHRTAPARGVVAVSLLALALAANRPEGVLFYPLYVLHLASRGRIGWRDVGRSLNVFVPGLALLLAGRAIYYGELLPNPFRAKLAGVPTLAFGVGYVEWFARRMGWLGWVSTAWAGLVVAVVWTNARVRPPPPERSLLLMATTPVLVQVAATIVMGGDYMSDFRFLRPVIGPLCLAVGGALVFVAGGGLRGSVLAVAIAAGLAVVHVRQQVEACPVFADAPPAALHKKFVGVSSAGAERYRNALFRFARPGDSQLVDRAGLMGYGHALRTVDATGLVSRDLERDFYLRGDFTEDQRRERLPGHARWPTVELMQRERFTLIYPQINSMPPTAPEITAESPPRTRAYPFLHVTVPVDNGEFLRFFTTLDRDELRVRAHLLHLELCVRRPFGELDCL